MPSIRKKHRRKPFRFDAALSFSGKNRKVAKAIKDAGEQIGLNIFYDKDRSVSLWGKNETIYDAIYGPESHTVVPLVSQDYLTSDYARHEFAVARREAKERDHEFILPVQLDDTLLIGLPETTGYLSIEEYSPCEIARHIKEKIEKLSGRKIAPASVTHPLLDSDERLALGIIATAKLPRKWNFYAKLFPRLDWELLLPKLESKGLVTSAEGIPQPTKDVAKAVSEESEEFAFLQSRWVTSLEPVKYHIDVAPAIALHYLQDDRIEDAVEVLSAVATGTELGWWNQIYLTALEALADRYFSKLPIHLRLQTLNACGNCLCHASRYADALDHYAKLRSHAKRAKDDYWIGQSFINAGVACFHGGDLNRAIKFYESARAHGTATRDWMLVGRSLGNLAESYRDTDIVKARNLLNESLKLKKRTKDESGLAAAEMQLGNFEASLGRPKNAVPHFRRCRDMSGQLGDLYLQSLALFNLGNAHLELGRTQRAVQYLSKSLQLAEDDGYDYARSLAALALGKATFEQEKYDEAKAAFTSLLSVAEEISNKQDQICSLHALAVIDAICEGQNKAKSAFSRSLRFARQNCLPHWYARCIADRARDPVNGKLQSANIGDLIATARRLERTQDHLYAGHIFLLAAQNVGVEGEHQENSYRDAERCLGKSEDDETFIQAILEFSDWQWQRGRFADSIETMRRAERAALQADHHFEACGAADQVGVRLQQLSRFRDAEKSHQRAVRYARKEGLVSLLETLLNNLGEAQRQLHKFKDAESSLQEAEQIAAAHDEESAISVAHNRALVYQDSGDHTQAETLFKYCREQSRKREFWREYVRAIEALANLACVQGQYALSRRRYVNAIKEAKSRKVPDLLPRLSLNYAHLELYLENPKVAVREMRRCLKLVGNEPDEHLFHLVLGRGYGALGNSDKAIHHLEIASSLAMRVGDIEQRLLALGALAEVYQNEDRNSDAAKILREIVDSEDDLEMKVAALGQLLEVQLILDDDDAQTTYDDASKLISKHELHEDNAHLHMTVGFHIWNNESHKRLEALQAMVVAQTSALLHDVYASNENSLAGEVIAESIRLLTSPETAATRGELRSLFDSLTEWVNANFTQRADRKFALSPCRMAIQLLPLNRTPKEFADRLNELIESDGLC